MTMVSLWLLFKVFCIVIVIPQNLGDFQDDIDQVSQSQWGDSGKVSETFENFRREMQARLQAQEAKSARQEQLLATALEYFGHNMKIFKKSEETFERFRQEMEERLYEHEKKSAAQEIKMRDLMRVIEYKERKSQEMSDAFEIITKNPEFSDLIQRSKMGAFPGIGTETEETLLLVTGGEGLFESQNHGHKILSEPEIFPATNNTECSLPSFPAGRWFHATFLTSRPSTLVATCGGIEEGKSKSDPIASCFVLDLINQSWDEGKMGNMTTARSDIAAVTMDNVGVFILGGRDSDTARSSEFLAAGTMTWQRGPPLPMEMNSPCLVAISATSFLAIYREVIHEFDASIGEPTSSEGWQEAGRWPNLRIDRYQGHGCARLGHQVIIAGGHGARWPGDDLQYKSRSTEVLDINKRTLSFGGDMASRQYFQLATINFGGRERVFAVGGFWSPDGRKGLDTVEEWVEELSIWKPADHLDQQRSLFGAVVLPRHLICSTEIRTAAAKPTTETTTSTTPRPCTAIITPMLCRTPGTCPTIASVYPSKLQRTTTRTLDLTVNNLPTNIGDKYFCAFSACDKVLLKNATRTDQGLSCSTPRTDLLPPIPQGESHFTSQLSIRAGEEEGPDLAVTNFTFFDCNTYSSCTACVSSEFPCDWCVDRHKCTHDTAEICRNDILVTGVNRLGPSIRSGPAFCPRVSNGTEILNGNEILVSSGQRKSISVKVEHIPQFIIQSRFVCQFNIEGRVTSVNAQLLDDTIHCDEVEFTYDSEEPTTTASFSVIWDQSKPLDNPDNIHVVIYKCERVGDNYESCLGIDQKYYCGWCQETRSCTLADECMQDP